MNDPRTFDLKSGKHDSPENGVCVMEAETVFWGLEFTDSHPCVSPILGGFLRSWNDALPTDADRNRLLRPFIGRLAGTKGTPEIELQRSWMAFDWLVRECAAEFLSMTPALAEHAKILRGLPEINQSNFDMAGPLIKAARAAAGAAAGAAAWAAAGAAAGAAAWDAARAAAGDAAWAAAWDATRDAARAAAGDADALQPSVARLQESAAKLVDRMIRLTEVKEPGVVRTVAVAESN